MEWLNYMENARSDADADEIVEQMRANDTLLHDALDLVDAPTRARFAAAIARAEAAEARVASWAGERAELRRANADLREKLERYMAYANTEARRLQRDAQVTDELVAFGRPSGAAEHITRPTSERPPQPPEFVVRRAERDSTLLMPTKASVASRWAKEHPTIGPAWNPAGGAVVPGSHSMSNRARLGLQMTDPVFLAE